MPAVWISIVPVPELTVPPSRLLKRARLAKPLLPVHGRPMIEWHLEALARIYARVARAALAAG